MSCAVDRVRPLTRSSWDKLGLASVDKGTPYPICSGLHSHLGGDPRPPIWPIGPGSSMPSSWAPCT